LTTISFEDMPVLLFLKMHFSYKPCQSVNTVLQISEKRLFPTISCY
jgi:hypothetical protein